jgi:hypothetical protein
MTERILAGNVDVMTATVTGVGTSVNPSTAVVYVSRCGVSELLPSTVQYAADNLSMDVSATWAIPDDQPGGVYTVTFDVSGAVAAAHHETIIVGPRYPAPT